MTVVKNGDDIGFTWWRVWSWLGLVPGSIFLLMQVSGPLGGWAILLCVINVVTCSFMLGYSRAAFLTLTIFSLNPILWIINGIYLKNRWNHPLVMAGSGRDKSVDPPSAVAVAASTPHAVSIEKSEVTTQLTTNDDYATAADEIDSGNVDKGLWSKLFAEADGDENRTRARYIKERVAMMRSS